MCGLFSFGSMVFDVRRADSPARVRRPMRTGWEHVMKLRCKAGDLAMVIRDFVGHEANLGRLVRVDGPLATDSRGMRTWLIEPIDGRRWAVGSPGDAPKYPIVRFRDLVHHPDQWLMPIRPTATEQGSVIARPRARCRTVASCYRARMCISDAL